MDTAQIDEALSDLRLSKKYWATLPIVDKIRYLDTIKANTVAVSRRWVESTVKAKSLSMDAPHAGEEWTGGPFSVLWLLKDLRKTCATYYDAHLPESSIEILGHSVGGVTYRHYAHRDPLAFKAIMTIPQPTAFTALMKG